MESSLQDDSVVEVLLGLVLPKQFKFGGKDSIERQLKNRQKVKL
mgnify:CR=1 FL=1